MVYNIKAIKREIQKMKREVFTIDNLKNKLKKTTIDSIKGAAVVASTASANTKCMFIFHQPKKPEQLKKLRKF